MVQIPDDLRCVFSAQVDQRDGSYIIEIPAQEVRRGTLQEGAPYRVAMLADGTDRGPTTAASEPDRRSNHPPVAEGDTREVEIDDTGDQGDGIARVERGFVVIVPETDEGERVTIEITEVRENVAFAEVVNRQTHVQ